MPEISIKAPNLKSTKKEIKTEINKPKIETIQVSNFKKETNKRSDSIKPKTSQLTEIKNPKIETKIEIENSKIETNIIIENELNQIEVIKNINDIEDYKDFKFFLESKMDILNVDKRFLVNTGLLYPRKYCWSSYIDTIYDNIKDGIAHIKQDYEKQSLEILKIIFNNDEHIKEIDTLNDIISNTFKIYNLYSKSLDLLHLIFDKGKIYNAEELFDINNILEINNKTFNQKNEIYRILVDDNVNILDNIDKIDEETQLKIHKKNYDNLINNLNNILKNNNESINEIPKDILETHKKNYNNLKVIINDLF